MMELSLLELGAEIRKRRQAQHISQQQVADTLDIPQAQISTFEQFGRGMKFERILAVCQHFGLTMHWTEETSTDAEAGDPPDVVDVNDAESL